MERLQKMTLDELQHVKNFTISNEFGEVQFEGEVDVTDVDLGDVVNIAHMEVEVYDQERHKSIYPPVGEKLNRPAIITYYKVSPFEKQPNTPVERKIEYLQKCVQAIPVKTNNF